MLSMYPNKLKHHEINWEKAYRYAKELEAGAVFPPIVVRQLPNGDFRVQDGAHRTAAHKLVGRAYIEAYFQES